MSFLKKLFGSNSNSNNKQTTNDFNQLKFGRYTDANKPEEQTIKWNTAIKLFNDKNYIESFITFFEYIKDLDSNSVKYSLENNKLNFEIIQGSKIIKGTANNTKFSAEAEIAGFDKTSVAFTRKLLDHNYILQYSKFALKNNIIYLKFDTNTLNGSPGKLYYALKELCVTADKQDDLLTDEFSMLNKIGMDHIIEIPLELKETKYKYLIKWIKNTLNRISELDETKDTGAMSFLVLALTFKIDYLLSPEGALMNSLEKISSIYYAKNEKPLAQKISLIVDEYTKILETDKKVILMSFYDVVQTFGVLNPATHKQVADFIFKEQSAAKWYVDNNYPDIVTAIYEYVCGYCLFGFGMYKPEIKYMHLFMQILNNDYFKEIGNTKEYINSNSNSNSKISGRKIIKDIESITQEGKIEFPNLFFQTSYLKFNTIQLFAESYMKEFDFLNFTKTVI